MRSPLPKILSVLLLTMVSLPALALELLVPAYFYPGGKGLTYWDQMVKAAPKAPVIAIVNPASGPGKVADSNYRNAVSRLRAAGGKVLGYVPTGYGTRATSAVVQDILLYQSFYPLDGIFLDEMGNEGNGTSLGYYANLYQYIKGLNASWRVIGNPGTNTLPVYLSYPSVDAVVMFEDQSRVYQRYASPSWVSSVPAASIGHLVTNVADFTVARNHLAQARQRNAGLIYLTNDKLGGNPWDTLPPWWPQLVSEVCLANGKSAC